MKRDVGQVATHGAEGMHVRMPLLAPVDELDAELEGALRCRRKSSSSIFTSRLNCAIAGIVASPTPTMPISEDSTSVIDSRGPSTRASAAAVIHPAVPPPAMTTDLIS